jgi:hypothetical protein
MSTKKTLFSREFLVARLDECKEFRECFVWWTKVPQKKIKKNGTLCSRKKIPMMRGLLAPFNDCLVMVSTALETLPRVRTEVLKERRKEKRMDTNDERLMAPFNDCLVMVSTALVMLPWVRTEV